MHFLQGELFFLLTGPLMGDPVVFPAKKDIPSCHKHVSNEENIIPAPIPALEDVLKEVIMYLP